MRRKERTNSGNTKSFNPRTHTGCDHTQKRCNNRVKRFNPRTHTGCDYSSFEYCCLCSYVSIHAPTRGATDKANEKRVKALVSIHAPTRGATGNILLYISDFKFQSTHPHGVRRVRDIDFVISEKVSIHAPTRGATLRPNTLRVGIRFNPRTHTGCDLLPLIPLLLRVCFNPRTHTGCDGCG